MISIIICKAAKFFTRVMCDANGRQWLDSSWDVGITVGVYVLPKLHPASVFNRRFLCYIVRMENKKDGMVVDDM